MPRDKIAGMLGMAQKAGQLKSGAFQVEKALKKKNAKLVIVANDISQNSFEEYESICERNGIPLAKWGTKDSLGHVIGKPMRAVVAVVDKGFAKRLKELLGGEVHDA